MKNLFLATTAAALCLLGAGCGDETTGSAAPVKTDREKDPYEKNDPYADLTDEFPPRVSVVNLPQRELFGQKITGSYRQHHEAIAKTYELAGVRMGPETPIIAIYPDDPDLVSESELTWYLAFKSETVAAPARASLTSIPQQASQAVVVETIAADTPGDGKKILAWIALNGYVQTAPTMMEYSLNPDLGPQEQRAKIIIPVKERRYFEEIN